MSGHAPESSFSGGPDFSLTPRQIELRARMRDFVANFVIPQEAAFQGPEGITPETIQVLRHQARAAGVYGPHLPMDLGGLGCDWRSVAIAFEEAGVSLIGPLAINGAAPDEGNSHLLNAFATRAQRETYLRPLAEGRIRSAFAMTEPAPGAGSDPTMLLTTAKPRGDDWVINGSKWYTSGAQGAAFVIVMARTSDDPDPRRGASLFIVDAGNPGMKVVGLIPTLDQHSFLGGHGELELRDCVVPQSCLLGDVGRGADYAQARLIPARLTHCMRWLGVARRAVEIATAYTAERMSGGKRLADHQMVQAMLADSAIELHASRLMIWHAAWRLDNGYPGREETSMAKVFVAEAVNRIIDRSLQVCGGFGASDRSLLSTFYRDARPFRILDGPSEVHRAAIARRLVRRQEVAAKT